MNTKCHGCGLEVKVIENDNDIDHPGYECYCEYCGTTDAW